MESIRKIELFDQLISICTVFEEKKIRYALIGGMALGFHNCLRTTMDIDFLILKSEEDKVKEILCNVKKLEIFHESPEVLQFNGEIDIDILWASRSDSINMLHNAIVVDKKIKVADFHDLIGLKIQAMSNDRKRKFKDLSDIQMLLENNVDKIDWTKIKYYADIFNQWPEINNMKKDIENV